MQKRGLVATPIKTTYDALLPPGKKQDETAVSEARYLLQKRFENMVERDKALNQLAREAFSSYVGAFPVGFLSFHISIFGANLDPPPTVTQRVV